MCPISVKRWNPVWIRAWCAVIATRTLVICLGIASFIFIMSFVWFPLKIMMFSSVVVSCSSRQSLGEQGWRSGESARLPPMWPGFDFQTRRRIWVEFVCSLLCSEMFFSGYSCFPLSSKTSIDLIWFVIRFQGHKFISPWLLRATLTK